MQWTVSNQGVGDATGDWRDRIFLSTSGTLDGAVLLGSLTRPAELAPGESYSQATSFAVPNLADGDYTLLVVTDAADELVEGVDGESNNTSAAVDVLTLRHADLQVTITSAPSEGNSGLPLTLGWTTRNAGTVETLRGWTDQVFFSLDDQLSADDRLLGTVAHSSPLGAGAAVDSELEVVLPADAEGSAYLFVLTDGENVISESTDEQNNTDSSLLNVTATPFADLVVTNVSAPQQLIDDPAELIVSWTVRNEGIGVGTSTQWDGRCDPVDGPANWQRRRRARCRI